MGCIKKNKGSALLSALFIMTLVAIAATAMSLRLQLDIYRTRLIISSDKLYLASQAVTFWAMDKLEGRNISLKTIGEGGKLMNFPSALENHYPEIVTKGDLYDMQALFNLNNLSDKKFQLFFMNILENSLPKLSASEGEELVNAITYWVSPYQPNHGQDHPLDYYLKQKPPYLPGYQLMQSPSELRLIKNVDASLYQTLLPFITVLPELTPININTASHLILKSLGNGLNETQLNELLQVRGQGGFRELNAITPLLQKLNIPADQITLESTYYLSIALTSSDDLNLTTYTILKRSKDKQGHISIGIILESINTL